MPHATAPTPNHRPALDGVRGLAVLLVMMNHFVHTAVGTVAQSPIERLAHTGWRGVDLFFVLSGYLITGRLLAAPRENYFRHFYARRVLRIFPLYYLALVVAYLSVPFLGRENAALMTGPSHPIWFFLYVPNLAMAWAGSWLNTPRWFVLDHFWSLAVEEQFYLAWPLVTRLASRTWALAAVCIAIALGAYWTTQSLWERELSFASYVFTPARLDGLALGALWATVERHVPTQKLGRASSWLLHALLVASIAAIVGELIPWPWLDRFVLVTFVAMVVAASIDAPAGPAVPWLAHPVLRWFGRYSYGLYVYHQLLQPLWRELFKPDTLVAALGRGLGTLAYSLLAGGVSMLLAWANWHAIEKRVLAYKARFGG